MTGSLEDVTLRVMKSNLKILIIVLIVILGGIYVIANQSAEDFPILQHGQVIDNQLETEYMEVRLSDGSVVEIDFTDTFWYKNEDLGLAFVLPPNYDPKNIVYDVDMSRVTYFKGRMLVDIEIGNRKILIRDQNSPENLLDIRAESPEHNEITLEKNEYREDYEHHAFKNPFPGVYRLYRVNRTMQNEYSVEDLRANKFSLYIYSDSLDELSFIAFIQSLREI